MARDTTDSPDFALISNGVHPIYSEQEHSDLSSILGAEYLVLDRSVNMLHGRIGGRDVRLLVRNSNVPSGLHTRAMRQIGVDTGGQTDQLLELVARRPYLIRRANCPTVRERVLTKTGCSASIARRMQDILWSLNAAADYLCPGCRMLESERCRYREDYGVRSAQVTTGIRIGLIRSARPHEFS